MDAIELKQKLIPNIQAGDFGQCLEVLREFKVSGGKQSAAYDVLQELRMDQVTEDAEDFVLEVMDIASGWCPPSKCIWGENRKDS